jgi:hypothetical protein
MSLTTLRRFYNAVMDEPLPDYFGELLGKLPDGSDGSEAGYAGSGLTTSGSGIIGDCGAPLSISTASAQSHNLNAKVSTRSGAKRFQ